MDHITFLVAVVIVAAPAFDSTNGFHDTANAMATSIATGALKPRTAVLISGVLNVCGALLSHLGFALSTTQVCAGGDAPGSGRPRSASSAARPWWRTGSV